MNGLKRLRKEKAIGQVELAQILGITQSSYSRYESGMRDIPIDMLNKLADYFGVSTDTILGRPEAEQDSPPNTEPSPIPSPSSPSTISPTQNLTNFDLADFPAQYPKYLTPLPDLDNETALAPILGSVYAGYDYMVEDNFVGYLEIDENLKKSFPDVFALYVKGNSMDPEIHPGSVALCVPSLEVRSGDLAIICINGDEGTIKRVKITKDGLTLIPANPRYPETTYTPDQVSSLPVLIQAKVIEVRKRYI